MAQSEKIKEAIATAVERNTGPEVTPAEADKIAAKTVATLKSDPVLANATGQEKWWQSGVAWFGTGGLLWSIGFLITEIAQNGADVNLYAKDINNVMLALGSIGGFLGVLYRRFWPGLKPFFWRWTHHA